MAPGGSSHNVLFGSFVRNMFECSIGLSCGRADCGVHAYRFCTCPAIALRLVSKCTVTVMDFLRASISSTTAVRTSGRNLCTTKLPSYLFQSCCPTLYFCSSEITCAWSDRLVTSRIALLPFSRGPHVAMPRIKPVQISGSISPPWTSLPLVTNDVSHVPFTYDSHSP